MKTKLLYLFFLVSTISFGQIVLLENFNSGTSLPSGWTQSGYFGTSTAACDGNSFRDNLYSFSTTGNITSPNIAAASNGTDVAVSVDYKVLNWSGLAATPSSSVGDINLEFSTDGGTTFTTYFTVNSTNHVSSDQCATIAQTIPAASVPSGSDFQWRLTAVWGAGDYYVYVDNVSIQQAGACFEPTAISNTAVTLTTADFSWTTSSSEDGGYNWEVVPAGNGQGVGVVASGTTAINATTLSVTGLTADTSYDLHLQSICGGSTSTWTSAFNFFTGYCQSIPSSNDGQGIGQVDVDGTVFTSGGDITYEDFRGTPAAVGNAVTMSIEFLTGYTYDTNIWIDYNNDLVYESSELVFDGVSTNSNPTTLDTSFVIPGTTAAGTYNVRIGTADSGQSTPNPCYSGSYGVTIDMVFDFTPTPCIDVSAITEDSKTNDSLTVSWTENNNPAGSAWEVIAVAAGAAAPAVGTTNATTNPYTITGLMGETSYDVYVRADCSSSFTGPVTMTTLCDPIAAPYTEDFESFTATTNFTGENCWLETSTTAYDFEVDGSGGTDSSGTGPSGANSGSTFIVVDASDGNNGDIATFVSPAIDLSALTNPALSFYYHMYGSEITQLDVAVSTDSGATYTSILTITGQQQTSSADAWGLELIDMIAYAGQTVMVKFETQKGLTGFTTYEGDVSLDDISFDELPPCLQPTMFSATSFTFDTVNLGWMNNAGAAAASVIYGPAGFDPTTAGTTVAAGADMASISGLMGSTTYDFYVAQDCSATGDGLSALTGPITVTTLCTPIVPDAYETFDTFLPSCWEEATDGDLTTGPTGLGSGDWGVEEFAHATTSGGGAMNINLYNLGTSDWVLSPLYDLSAGGYELNVDVALTAYNSTNARDFGSDDFVSLVYSTDFGVTWTVLETWDVTNQPSNTGDRHYEDLSMITSGAVQFAFYGSEGTVDDPEDIDFHMDNFEVRTPPACNAVANMSLVDQFNGTATINFDSTNPISMGDYEISVNTAATSSPMTTAAWTDVAGATPNVTYSIPGLTAQTTYYVYVRELCSTNNYGPWSTALVFTTPCEAIATFPSMADMSSAANNCWAQATAGELQTGPSSLGSSDWRDGRAYTNYNGTVVNSMAMNLYSNVDREWLMLDYYDLSGTANDVLTVEVAVTDYTFSGTSAATDSDAMGSDDEVHLLVSEDRGATWSVLKTWDSTTSPVATGERSYIDISAYNGVVRFAFLATDGTVDDVADYDFHVGEFIIDTTASNDVLEVPMSEVSLYPNPVAGDYLNIAMGVDVANVSIMVYNTLGQQVMTRDYTNTGQEIRVDGLSNLNAGVYIINIAIDDRLTTRRFIKE
jgi:hypothetical protein